MSAQEDFQNQQQYSEESEQARSEEIQTDYTNENKEPFSENINEENLNQPEQSNNQPESMDEIGRKPYIEIRDIPSYSSPEQDQYTQVSEKQNQLEQNSDNSKPDYQGH